MCMLDSLKYIGVDVSEMVDQVGPFSAWDFNNMIHASQGDDPLRLLIHHELSDMSITSTSDGESTPTVCKFLCLDRAVGHFFGVSACNGQVNIFDNQVGVILYTSISLFLVDCHHNDFVYYVPMTTTEIADEDDDIYKLLGGGKKAIHQETVT